MKRSQLQSWGEESPPPARWWAFYVRVTKEESLKKDLSVPNQCARAREIAAARGWTDYRIYVEEKNVSAELWTEKRPAFREMIDDIVSGNVIGVCARHTDRFWRGNEIQGRFLRVLKPLGIELWDFNSRYDYKSAHGRFSLQVLGAASELEVGLMAERIREMRRGKAIRGQTGGGAPPFGYTSQSRRMAELVAADVPRDEAYRQACLQYPVGKCWYVDEDEAQIVRLMFKLYTDPQYRYGAKRIARYLHQHGFHPRKTTAFSVTFIMKVINSPSYAGFTSFDEDAYENRMPSKAPRHKQKLYRGEHPALIEPELWQAAQQIKETERTVQRTRKTQKGALAEIFSLTGIMSCPQCGAAMVGKSTQRRNRGVSYRYYQCCRRYNGGIEACSMPTIPAEGLQDAVWKWVHDLMDNPAFVMEQLERMQKKYRKEQPASRQQLVALRRRREALKAGIEKYFRVFESAQSTEPDVAILDRVRALRAELQSVEADVAALETRSAPAELEVSPERVRRYLAKLRQKVAEHADLQRVLFLELQREHDLQVRVAPSGEEFTASIALPTEAFAKGSAGAPEQKVLISVLKNPDAGGGPRVWRKVNDASATLRATLCMALRSCRARSESLRSICTATVAASPAMTRMTS